MAKKKTSIITVKVNGKSLEGKPGIKVNLGGPVRTPAKAGGRIVGYHEEIEPSNITVNVVHDGDIDIEEVRGWVDVTLVLDMDSGASYQVDGAFVMKALEINDGEGGMSIEFGGPPASAI